MTRILLTALLALGLLPAAASAEPVEYRTLDHLPVGPFTLTERAGEKTKVTREDLLGKVWVAHFFFTTCPGPCTKTRPAMIELQKRFAGKPDVRLVSITVDSSHETLGQLRDYADQCGADPEQWLFLTGDEAEVHRVIRESFFQGVDRDPKKDPGQDITHSQALLVIDRDGVIDGYADGTRPDSADVIARHVREVASRRYRLPAVNAGLNTLCTLLLVAGYVAIRRRAERVHIACMVAALVTSAVFLTCYLYFHFAILGGEPTRFRGVGGVRTAYFAILLTHTVLAIVVAPLALYVAYLGWRDRRPRHVRVARWTLPIWLYVSVTGVVVYVLLYQLYPPY
jgi:protein SCO1/2/putative membrane protein